MTRAECEQLIAEALAESWLVDQLDCAEVAAVLAPTVQRVQALTLREAAADYLWRDAGGRTDAPGGARHWLRARADQIDGRDTEEGVEK